LLQIKAETPYLPIFELTRGEAIESLHFGAFAIVNNQGKLLASHGDPRLTSFLRSSAKPFQVLPFIESGGQEMWKLTSREIAIMCASHTGTNEHVRVLAGIQSKIKVSEADLLCGVHPPVDEETRNTLLEHKQEPTPNRHNCSGKHTGMLAHAKLIMAPIDNYIEFDHPIQKRILQSFSKMCAVDDTNIATGIDGCSAPVFAIPLYNAALGYARLCDPKNLPHKRASACQTITTAMMSHPDMVAGPGKFDTRLMEITGGKLISKGGAEGYQQIGIMKNAIKPGSPGIGIAIKISDGDARSRVRPAICLEILRQLGAINPDELEALSAFGPRLPVLNWREINVGEAYPTFKLKFSGPQNL
jgi:L-asparaginase II